MGWETFTDRENTRMEGRRAWMAVRSAIARCRTSSVTGGTMCSVLTSARRRKSPRSTTAGNKYL